MKTLLAVGLLMASTAASACFLSGETTDGMNKICYYDCVSGKKAITVRATQMCPMRISKAPGAGVFASKYPAAPVLVAARQ